MIINYKKSKYVTEEFEIEIEDIYNCFLQGNSENKNITDIDSKVEAIGMKKFRNIKESKERCKREIISYICRI